MGRRPTGRPRGRPRREEFIPPPPDKIEVRCPHCGAVNKVPLDRAIYADLTKAAAHCGKCETRLL